MLVDAKLHNEFSSAGHFHVNLIGSWASLEEERKEPSSKDRLASISMSKPWMKFRFASFLITGMS